MFNIAGELVGVFVAALPTISEGNETGVNTVRGRQFRDANNASDIELRSGVYLYSITTLDDQMVRTDAVRGKFAIVD